MNIDTFTQADKVMQARILLWVLQNILGFVEKVKSWPRIVAGREDNVATMEDVRCFARYHCNKGLLEEASLVDR